MANRIQPDFPIYLITDRHQTNGRPLVEVVEAALRGGIRAVQLREKDLSTRELYELAYKLRKLTARYGARLLINDRIDVALAVEADGVHLGQNSLPVYKARKLLGDDLLIGVSCHNQVSAITAQEKGADFITFGPVYFTPSKAQYGKPVGVDRLAYIANLLRIPVFALGGIKLDNAREVMAADAAGIALISAVLTATDPADAVHNLLAIVQPHASQEV